MASRRPTFFLGRIVGNGGGLSGKGIGLSLADGVTALTEPEDGGEELRVSQSTAKLAIKSRWKIAAKCTNPIVAKLAIRANSVNALITVDGLAGCLLDDHLDRADAMVAYEFGANPPNDNAARKCPSGLARAGLTCTTTLDGMVGADGTTGCFIEGHDAERFQTLRKQYCDEKICPQTAVEFREREGILSPRGSGTS